MINDAIKLEPPSTSGVEGGLRIEMVEITDRLNDDADQLPISWPFFSETLLVLETTELALVVEDMEDEGSPALTRHRQMLREFRARYDDYIEPRTRGVVQGERHSLGA